MSPPVTAPVPTPVIDSGARSQLRWFARLEGISYLVLLLIAVPLKHLAGEPIAVRVNGPIHGVLFLGFLIALARVAAEERWPWRRTATWFIASLVPLALFWLERDLRAPPPDPAPDAA